MKRIFSFFEYYGGFLGILVLIYDRISFYTYKKYFYKKIFLNYGNNIRWGKHGLRLTIPKNIRISSPHKISIGDNCQFDEYVYLQVHHEGEKLIIKNNVRVNAFTHIQAYSEIIINDYVLIAPFSHINSGNHGFDNMKEPIMNQAYKKAGIILIGKGSWIGRNSHILGNVQIGKNTVIGAGSVVTKSFDEFSIIVGVPARLIRKINANNNQ